ncbi:hypothetical protein K6V98_07235 [Collinsella sp. AGMB00827]|uniref:Uncharacterized protein n=1 Tax=Collinsella ureilytica TaxID=2869515 RepID=A0ABS7ML99_9ACTN|nr:hypothetical protein [Collinsella urealyticum]MBY4798136.1 hypothetical protein [Collinsella urealyticum]
MRGMSFAALHQSAHEADTLGAKKSQSSKPLSMNPDTYPDLRRGDTASDFDASLDDVFRGPILLSVVAIFASAVAIFAIMSWLG